MSVLLCPTLCPRRTIRYPKGPLGRRSESRKDLVSSGVDVGTQLGRRSSKPRVGGSNPSGRAICTVLVGLPSVNPTHESELCSPWPFKPDRSCDPRILENVQSIRALGFKKLSDFCAAAGTSDAAPERRR